jgi:hypothetical protein
MFPRDCLEKYMVYMYNVAKELVTVHSKRSSALGTIDQEHLHGKIRQQSHNDARMETIDRVLGSVLFQGIWRGESGLSPSVDCSTHRSSRGSVHFPPASAEGMPAVRDVLWQVARALSLSGVNMPLGALEEMAAVFGKPVATLRFELTAAQGEDECVFLHEVLDFSPLVGVIHSSAAQARIIATRGGNGLQRRVAAGQAAHAGVLAGGRRQFWSDDGDE